MDSFKKVGFEVAGWVVIATLAIIALIGIGGPLLIVGLPDCLTEDSDNCHWDGGENGLGDSFIVLNGVVFETAL